MSYNRKGTHLSSGKPEERSQKTQAYNGVNFKDYIGERM
jgi:hypothetical protein